MGENARERQFTTYFCTFGVAFAAALSVRSRAAILIGAVFRFAWAWHGGLPSLAAMVIGAFF